MVKAGGDDDAFAGAKQAGLAEALGTQIAQETEAALAALPAPEIDSYGALVAALISAVMIAGVQQVVLSAASIGGFAGMPLAEPADWERLHTTIRHITIAACSPLHHL